MRSVFGNPRSVVAGVSGLVLVALAAPPVAAAKAPARESASSLGQRLDDWAKPPVASQVLSGAFIVSRHDTVLVRRAWGLANREFEIANTVDTRFAIASLTKPMTTMCVLTLVREGKVRLEDSVARWIPDFPHGDRITVTDLIAHRARIPHRVTTAEEEVVPITPADIVRRIIEKGLPGPPDGSRSYSSTGYAVLARIIELADGRDYGTAMRKRVFKPLGMTHTLHADSRDIIPSSASAYVPGPSHPLHAPLKDLSFLAGGGSLWSTVGDVMRFGQGVLEERGLDATGWWWRSSATSAWEARATCARRSRS